MGEWIPWVDFTILRADAIYNTIGKFHGSTNNMGGWVPWFDAIFHLDQADLRSVECTDFWVFFKIKVVDWGIILGISTKWSGILELFSSDWFRISKLLLVDGLEALAIDSLRIEEGFLWSFLRLVTFINPSESGLSSVGEFEVFRFEGRSWNKWPREWHFLHLNGMYS